MRLEDLDPVMEIENVAFKHPWSTDLFRRELEHDWSTILVVIEPLSAAEGGCERLAGFVIYWLVHDEVHVLNVATHPKLRRRGIARLLMDETISRARTASASLLTLEVRRSNDGAISLYRQLGFRSVGIRPKYYVDEDEDAIVMVKDL